MSKRDLALVGFLVLSFGAAGFGALFTTPAVKAGALGLFLAQLVLNAAWSWLFFGLHSPPAGLAGIGCLWIAILLTIVAFFQVSPLAGWLMVPYLLWVTFASGLNFTIWRLNG